MKPAVRFLGMVLALWAGIVGLGVIASLALPAPLVGSTLVVSIGSILFGSALLAGSDKSKQTSRGAYVTNSIMGSQVWGSETRSEAPSPNVYTPSGLPSKTKIKSPGQSWMTVSSFGAAACVAGLATLALAILFYPLLL